MAFDLIVNYFRPTDSDSLTDSFLRGAGLSSYQWNYLWWRKTMSK